MRVIIISLLLIVALASCGTTEESRYRNTDILERPPILAVNRPKGELRVTDNSTIPKKREEFVLGSDVYMTTTTPPQLRIKQPFDKTWNLLNQALKLSDIKITDHERNKGHLYVSYGSSSLFEKATSFLMNEHKETNYLLLVKKEGDETTITVTMTNTTEQNRSYDDHDGYYEQQVDTSEELLKTLYKTIRDDLVDE
jgi:uncharacterized lipoprotein